MWGVNYNTYSLKNGDDRHPLDLLDTVNHRPYLVALTCLVESPMKMFVLNQNAKTILFGSDDGDSIKNVVRFEANLRWFDFYNILPVENKKIANWKITDFNNVLNENPLFEE